MRYMSYDKIIHSLNLAGRCSISKNIKNQVLHNGKILPPGLHQQAYVSWVYISSLTLSTWHLNVLSDVSSLYISHFSEISSVHSKKFIPSGEDLFRKLTWVFFNVEILNWDMRSRWYEFNVTEDYLRCYLLADYMTCS